MMKDGAIVCNSGHFNVEIDIPALEKLSSRQAHDAQLRRGIHPEGRPQDQPAGRRPPDQPGRGRRPSGGGDGYELCRPGALGRVLVKNHASLEKKVYKVPEELDKRVARLKLESMGIKIDRLTPEQEEYLAGWAEGT